MISLFFRMIGFMTSTIIAAALVYLCFSMPNQINSASSTPATHSAPVAQKSTSAATEKPSRLQEFGQKVDQTFRRVDDVRTNMNNFLDSADRAINGDRTATPAQAKEEKKGWLSEMISNSLRR